jgi:uncharacterized protein
MTQLELGLLDERFAICRLPAGSPLPDWFAPGPLASATWTEDELSILTLEADVPPDARAERGWRVFKVVGPLDFALTGILASMATPLAEAGISIFALSTYDTDYVLVPEGRLEGATRVLGSRFRLS